MDASLIWEGKPQLKSRTSSRFSILSLPGISHFTVPRIASPWDHEKPQHGPVLQSSTVKQFDYRVQRRRLFVNSFFQFAITLLICGAIAGVLAAYSHRKTVSQDGRHAFNAIITGLALCLGLNVQSSFRGYASMLRWRFMMGKYRTLQEFELVMSCSSQMKVLRLMWTAKGNKKFPWVSSTQFAAFSFLFVNVALQVLVALLGLTYNMDTSTDYIDFQKGILSVSNLSCIQDTGVVKETTSLLTQQATAQAFGIAGQDSSIQYDPTPNDLGAFQKTIYMDSDMTWAAYEFLDQNAVRVGGQVQQAISGRLANTTAVCKQQKINQGLDIFSGSVEFFNTTTNHWENFTLSNIAGGCTTFISDTQGNCDDTDYCQPIAVFQLANDVGIVDSSLFFCNNTMSNITGIGDMTGLDDPGNNRTNLELLPPQAWLWAGAIGWTGFQLTDINSTSDNGTGGSTDPRQYQTYSQSTQWSIDTPLDAQTAAALIMRYSMYGIAAWDAGGARFNWTGYAPVPAQNLSIEWIFTELILAAVPAVQFLALMGVIIFGNKAVIKDDSFLAGAQLLQPVVRRLEGRGCALTGDEIADKLKNYKVAYGYRTPENWSDSAGMVRHLDIIEENEGLGIQRAMPAGRYDGVYDEKNDDGRTEEQSQQLESQGVRKRRVPNRRMSF